MEPHYFDFVHGSIKIESNKEFKEKLDEMFEEVYSKIKKDRIDGYLNQAKDIILETSNRISNNGKFEIEDLAKLDVKLGQLLHLATHVGIEPGDIVVKHVEGNTFEITMKE